MGLLVGLLLALWFGVLIAQGVKRPSKAAASHQRLAGQRWYGLEVVGEAHYQDALAAFCGGYSRDGYELVCDARLVPEPDNPHDANAVRVEIGGRKVGYISRGDAPKINAELSLLGLDGAGVVVGAMIRGGWRRNQHDQGAFGVWLNPARPLRLAD
jgi:hypothetical protein